MPRQKCCGLIEDLPICTRFFPEPFEEKQPVVLQCEELEAIRMKDSKGWEQTECAAAMGLSRATYQRILQSAREKVAKALVEGRTIIIEGGHYIVNKRVFECVECHHVWEVEPCTEGGKHGYEIACPQCGSFKKMKLDNGVKHACGGNPAHEHGHEHGQGGCGCGGHA